MAESFRHIADQARRSIRVCSLGGVRIPAAEKIVENAVEAKYLVDVKTDIPIAVVHSSPEDVEVKAEVDRLTEKLEAFWQQPLEDLIKDQDTKQKELDSLLIQLDKSFGVKEGK